LIRINALGDLGDPMMAHIAMMRALHRHGLKAVTVPRRKSVKTYRIVR
jgi:hypothetical protein